MSSVKLRAPLHPVVLGLALLGVTVASGFILWKGIPSTAFHGVQTGIFFPMEVSFADARFMDNKIKCTSVEVTAEVRKALVRVQPDYPVALAVVNLENYPSGYKFQVRYATYYAQRLSFQGDPWFRRGSEVGDPVIDAELKARDGAFEQAIRSSIEAYFLAKGAQ